MSAAKPGAVTPGAAEEPASRRPRLAVRLLGAAIILSITLVVTLLLAEFTVRVAAPQQLILVRPDLWMPVDTLGWLRRPGTSGTLNTGEGIILLNVDREGYRVGRAGRREAATKILLMGDSFMEALQVEHEQTVAHLLENVLSERLNKPVVVRNAGVAGWNPNHYLLRTRQLLSRDSFALVVVAVFVGNDAVGYRVDRIPPRSPVRRHDFRLPRRPTWTEFVQAILAPMNDGLEVRSHLYILAKNQLSTLRMRMGLTADYLPAEYRKDEATSQRWETTAEISRDLARSAAQRGVPVLFVLIPERFQVYPDDFRRYLRGFGIDSSTVDVEQPSRLLYQAFKADSLRVVDALPAMRSAAAASDQRLYGSVDQHLSAAGHAALTNVMWPEIVTILRR